MPAIDASLFSLAPVLPALHSGFEERLNRRFQGIPSVACLPSGRLFVVFYACREPWEGPGNYVVLCTSTDCGLSWKEVQVVSPGEARAQERCFDSELWLAPDGALWWFWTQCHSVKEYDTFDGRGGVWAARCAEPDCDCPRWEAPRRLGEGIMMNKPTLLADGSWVLCASLWGWAGAMNKTPAGLGICNRPNLLVSHDNGGSFEWHPGPELPMPWRNCDEHMAVERRDGALWMLIRTNYGIAESTSADKGATWSAPSLLPFGGLATRFSISRLRSGKLLLVYHRCLPLLPGEKCSVLNGSDERRDRLCAWYSEDDGATWKGGLMLDERSSVSYPSVCEGPDGFIYVTYDRERTSVGQILLSRFTEADLLRGEFVTPGSYRSVIVSALPAHP